MISKNSELTTIYKFLANYKNKQNIFKIKQLKHKYILKVCYLFYSITIIIYKMT
jgi:hypothetical protein